MNSARNWKDRRIAGAQPTERKRSGGTATRNFDAAATQQYTQNGVAMTSIRVAVNSRRNVP